MNTNSCLLLHIDLITETIASLDRNLRPSDSSIENDSIVFTYAQRFSKLPSDEFSQRRKNQSRRPKPVSDLLLEEADLEERNKETNSSDTENASPAITYGPKDNTCVCFTLLYLTSS